MRQRLLKVPSVVKVNLYGVQDEKIFVEFSHAKLATLGIPPQAALRFACRGRTRWFRPARSRPARSASRCASPARSTARRPSPRRRSRPAGATFRLGDIATVTRGFEDPSDYLVRQRGKPALGIGVVMAKGANILDFGKAVGAATDEFMAAVPQGIDIEQIADQPRVVDHAIVEFVRSFAEALGHRARRQLPVARLAHRHRRRAVGPARAGHHLRGHERSSGIDLHRITLGALIIALGLLVDDAIIAVEMMVVKIEQGWDRMRAAAFAWTSTAFPMLTGTLVTAAGFLPIGFANSSVGEYAGGIFWVVAIALVASWFVAVIFTPYLGVKLLPKDLARARARQTRTRSTRPASTTRCAAWWRSACAAAALTVARDGRRSSSLSVLAFGRVQQQFFPLSERPELFFQMRLPEGTAIGVTAETARQGREAARGDDPDVVDPHHLYRPGLAALLARPQPAAAERGLRRDRDRVEGRRRARAHQGADREGGGGGRPDRGARAGRPFQFRPAGRLPGAVPGGRPGSRRRCARSPTRCARSCATNRNVIDPHLDWNEHDPVRARSSSIRSAPGRSA